MNGNRLWNESKSFLRRVEADKLGPFANVLSLITAGLPLPLREGLFPSKTEVLSFQLLLFGEEMGKSECSSLGSSCICAYRVASWALEHGGCDLTRVYDKEH